MPRDERHSVRVDLPQPLVAYAKAVRNLVPDDVAQTFGQVGFAAGQRDAAVHTDQTSLLLGVL